MTILTGREDMKDMFGFPAGRINREVADEKGSCEAGEGPA